MTCQSQCLRTPLTPLKEFWNAETTVKELLDKGYFAKSLLAKAKTEGSGSAEDEDGDAKMAAAGDSKEAKEGDNWPAALRQAQNEKHDLALSSLVSPLCSSSLDRG